MKHLLTLALCLFSLGAMAQGSFPYNPDANENGTVGSEDLLAFLSVYGLCIFAFRRPACRRWRNRSQHLDSARPPWA